MSRDWCLPLTYLPKIEPIKGLEHRLGLAQDRIAEIHPSGCVPPAKRKPGRPKKKVN